MDTPPDSASVGARPAQPFVRAVFLHDHDDQRHTELFEYLLRQVPSVPKLVRRERTRTLVHCLVFVLPLSTFAGYQLVLRRLLLQDQFAALGLGVIIGIIVTALFSFYQISNNQWASFLSMSRPMYHIPHPGNEVQRATLDVDEKGIWYRGEDSGTHYGWKYFENVFEFDKYVAFVYANQLNGIPVPFSAFADAAERERFVAASRGFLQASGYALPDRIKASNSEANLACAKCGYPLAGLEVSHCPECNCRVIGVALIAQQALRSPWWRFLLTNRPPRE
jgi:hypothetical protein